MVGAPRGRFAALALQMVWSAMTHPAEKALSKGGTEVPPYSSVRDRAPANGANYQPLGPANTCRRGAPNLQRGVEPRDGFSDKSEVCGLRGHRYEYLRRLTECMPQNLQDKTGLVH